MLAVADRLDALASAEADVPPAVDVLRYCADALRMAAARVVEVGMRDEGLVIILGDIAGDDPRLSPAFVDGLLVVEAVEAAP